MAVYAWKGGWRPALARWPLDVLAVGSALVFFASGFRERLSFAEQVDHAREIGDQALTIFAEALVPFASIDRGPVLLIAAIVIGLALAVWALLPKLDPARAELRRWLLIFGAGVGVAALGWAILVPVDEGYVPDDPGMQNRINAFAVIGLVIAVYAVLALIANVSLSGTAAIADSRLGDAGGARAADGRWLCRALER